MQDFNTIYLKFAFYNCVSYRLKCFLIFNTNYLKKYTIIHLLYKVLEHPDISPVVKFVPWAETLQLKPKEKKNNKN